MSDSLFNGASDKTVRCGRSAALYGLFTTSEISLRDFLFGRRLRFRRTVRVFKKRAGEMLYARVFRCNLAFRVTRCSIASVRPSVLPHASFSQLAQFHFVYYAVIRRVSLNISCTSLSCTLRIILCKMSATNRKCSFLLYTYMYADENFQYCT